MPGLIRDLKSGAVIFFRWSSTITSFAICRRLAAQSGHLIKLVVHLGDPPLEPRCQGFIGECRADNGGDNLMEIGQTLDLVRGGSVQFDASVFGPHSIEN